MAISKKRKDLLRELVKFVCEGCKKHEDETGKLEVHRIRTGADGGTYHHRNCQLLCSECHKLRDYI